MTVTLSYALQNGAYVHISDKFPKETTLYCPHCQDEVIAKKGLKMQHHFSHKPYSRCSTSAESLLHFESKMYLKQRIIEKTPLFFQASVEIFPREVKRWYALLGNRYADVALLDLINTYGIRNATEETGILGYIPDILGIGAYSFAFEIYVTHALEEKKIDAFQRADVDYIELVPTREEDGTFSYSVHNAYLPRYFTWWQENIENTFEQEIKPDLYQELKQNEGKLMEKIKEELLPKIQEEVCETLERNIEQFYLTYGEKLTRTQRKNHQIAMDAPSEATETLRLKEAFVRSGKNGMPYLLLQDEYKRKFTMDGTHELFCSLLNELNTSYEIHLLTNEKGNIGGISFVNTLDKLGFDAEVQLLLKRNLQVLKTKQAKTD